MLTSYENRFNVWVFRGLSILNFLPIQIVPDDHGNVNDNAQDNYNRHDEMQKSLPPAYNQKFKILRQTSQLRLWLWGSLFFLFILQGIYIDYRLVQSLLIEDMFRIRHLPIHIIWAFLNKFMSIWAYLSFLKWPDFTVALFNEIISSLSLGQTKSQGRLSRQDLLAANMGVMLVFTALILTIGVVFDSTRAQLIYTAFPPSFRNNGVYLMCAIVEGVFVTYFCSIGLFVLLGHVMFFEMANYHLQEIEKKIADSYSYPYAIRTSVALQGCSKLRMLQLLIQLFNQTNSVIIFFFKIECILLPILGGYFAIRYTSTDPALGVLCCLVTGDALVLYSIIYEKAFRIPQVIEKTKEEIQMAAQASRNTKAAHKIKRIIHSLPTIAIHVGGFNKMERNSTLIFIHFVTLELLGLLVSF